MLSHDDVGEIELQELQDHELIVMTLETAQRAGAELARRTHAVYCVFRYPGWPVGQWSVRRREQLAENAMIHEYCTPPRGEGQRPLF